MLAAPHSGSPEVFVDTADELDVVLFQDVGVGRICLVHTAHGRTPVAGNQTGSAQTSCGVGAVLVQKHSHKCLDTGQGDRASGRFHAVAQVVLNRSHAVTLDRPTRRGE